MRIVLDTGILLRLSITADPLHDRCADWISVQISQGARFTLCPQNLYEFWVVVTRPIESGGYGLSPSEAYVAMKSIIEQFDILTESSELYVKWMDLCLQHSVTGRPAHDARLVALMLDSGVNNLATLNPQDFKRYPITIHVP